MASGGREPGGPSSSLTSFDEFGRHDTRAHSMPPPLGARRVSDDMIVGERDFKATVLMGAQPVGQHQAAAQPAVQSSASKPSKARPPPGIGPPSGIRPLAGLGRQGSHQGGSSGLERHSSGSGVPSSGGGGPASPAGSGNPSRRPSHPADSDGGASEGGAGAAAEPSQGQAAAAAAAGAAAAAAADSIDGMDPHMDGMDGAGSARAAYGFVFWVVTLFSALFYLLWAYLPDHILVPSKLAPTAPRRQSVDATQTDATGCEIEMPSCSVN